jgi:hypothetical protein
VYKASSTNTYVQYDRFLKPKEVIQEILAEKVANITHNLTSQSLIIKSFWNEAFPDMVKDWYATIYKLPKNIYNFVTRYLNNTLPTLKNMILWNKTLDLAIFARRAQTCKPYNMSFPLVRPIWTKGATLGVTTQFLNILSSIYQALRKIYASTLMSRASKIHQL